ncbi:transcriptional regulator domain-containing protein, partial [Sulfitobacter sp. 1A13679]|uniref:transcriptional regulator domain-containing protein n=1 Tax=Sulfitobacter sp. 1A13679 TaxID=3368597 RepID=UPI003745AC3C
ASDLAWEWLRRNKRYAKDYATLSKAAPDDAPLKEALLDKWGLRFRDRSQPPGSKGLRTLGPPDRSLGGRAAEGSGGPERRSGSVCLNRFRTFSKWFSVSVTPLPYRAASG